VYAISNICPIVNEDDLDVFLTGSKQHTEAIHAAKLCGLQICNDDDLFTDQIIGRIKFGNTGNDLSLFISEIDLKLKKLLCLRDRLCRQNFSHTKLDRTESIDRDLRLVLGFFDRLVLFGVFPFLQGKPFHQFWQKA